MKKLLPALATTLILGMTSTGFAASNPFSDVPAGHWAYNSVARLAAEGVIEGYGDGTYRGSRLITRYEMAQMVARALAKNPAPTPTSNDSSQNSDDSSATSNISGASRAELDKLAAEFREELNDLGVRVAELEKHSDFLKWRGKIKYTLQHSRTAVENTAYKEEAESERGVVQLNVTAKVNSHWKANARFEAKSNLKADKTFDAQLKRVWAEGSYNKFNIRLGRMNLLTNENGLVWDTDFSGMLLRFGSRWRITGIAGRIAADNIDSGVLIENNSKGDPVDLIGLNLQYTNPSGLSGGLGWYQVKGNDFKTTSRMNNIESINLSYAFSDRLGISGSYAQNTRAGNEKHSWQAQIEYGTYDDYPEQGAWNVFAAYRQYGTGVSFAPTTEGVLEGGRGWNVGTSYAPFKNVGVELKYFKGKDIDSGVSIRNVWGRATFFF